MKPIEPGCLVLLANAYGEFVREIGMTFTVTGPERAPRQGGICLLCHSSTVAWPLSDGCLACGCCLIRIDDDPDAVTEPEQHEVEA